MECAAHRLDGSEAAGESHDLDRSVRRLERDARRLDANGLDVRTGSHTELLAKSAREVALAHVRALGKRGNGEVGVEVLGDPVLELAQRLALGGLRRELRAELRLAARALHEHDEPARHLQCRLAAEVLLDQREREVHARRHARPTCTDVAVAHVDLVGLDRDRRELVASKSQLAQWVVARRPSSSPAAPRRKAPVHTEHTRRERFAAVRTHDDEARVSRGRRARPPARDDQRVDRPAATGDAVVDGEAHGRGAHRPRVRGDELHRVAGRVDRPAVRKTSAGPMASSG